MLEVHHNYQSAVFSYVETHNQAHILSASKHIDKSSSPRLLTKCFVSASLNESGSHFHRSVMLPIGVEIVLDRMPSITSSATLHERNSSLKGKHP